jgi:hypothetical protein
LGDFFHKRIWSHWPREKTSEKCSKTLKWKKWNLFLNLPRLIIAKVAFESQILPTAVRTNLSQIKFMQMEGFQFRHDLSL